MIEQTPGVEYKIATADGSVHVIKASDVVKMTKQRNKDFRTAAAAPVVAPTGDRGQGVSRSAEPSGSSLPPPTVMSGFRLEPAAAIVFPAGDISKGTSTSFSPDIRAGYEALFGNFGLEGGGMARFTYWRASVDTKDAAWTLETMAYGRLALHVSRVAMHAGVALGLDTNYIYSSMLDMSKTTTGFGMNLQSGIDIAASPTLAFRLGFDYHPGTDKIIDGVDSSISYYALLVGAGLRL